MIWEISFIDSFPVKTTNPNHKYLTIYKDKYAVPLFSKFPTKREFLLMEEFSNTNTGYVLCDLKRQLFGLITISEIV